MEERTITGINRAGVTHANGLIAKGKVKNPDSWNPPTAAAEDAYLKKHTMADFGAWHLGVDSGADSKTKGHYGYIFTSDFETVDRKGLAAIRQRAGQQGQTAIFDAAGKMIEKIDAKKKAAELESVREAVTGEMQYRTVTVEREAVSVDARTVSVSFCSEKPVQRFYGFEVLDCKPQSVRMGRLLDGAPLLLQHDPAAHIGTVEGALIADDAVDRATVRFGKGDEADEVFQDVVDGIRKKVSVGYMVHTMVLESKDGEVATYRVTDWEPFEISFVSVPADNTVGVGRANSQPQYTMGVAMPDEKKDQPSADQPVQPTAEELEATRKEEITAIAKRYVGRVPNVDKMRDEAIALGVSVELFRGTVFTKITDDKPLEVPALGLSNREARSYSFVKLINALANPTDTRAMDAASFEMEVSRELLKRSNRPLKMGAQATIPYELMVQLTQSRALIAGTTTMGGYTVGTDILAAQFIDVLRNRMVFQQAGAMYLTGLQGIVSIPAKTTETVAYWVAENAAPTSGQAVIGQVGLTPKTVGAYTDISRRLLIQSSMDINAMIQRDLADSLAVAIEGKAINGTGAPEISGLLASTSIGSSTGGANGLAPTWANILELESVVGVANADVGALAYITNAKVRGKLKATVKATNVSGMVWDSVAFPVNGYSAYVTSNVPSNLTKGTATTICSAIIFGNWNEFMFGFWGDGVDILVDPYTGSNAGTIRVRALCDVDANWRHAGSFSAMKDALTT